MDPRESGGEAQGRAMKTNEVRLSYIERHIEDLQMNHGPRCRQPQHSGVPGTGRRTRASMGIAPYVLFLRPISFVRREHDHQSKGGGRQRTTGKGRAVQLNTTSRSRRANRPPPYIQQRMLGFDNIQLYSSPARIISL